MFLDFFKATIPHNHASKFEQLPLWFFSNLTFLEHHFRTFFVVFSVVYRVINLPRVQIYRVFALKWPIFGRNWRIISWHQLLIEPEISLPYGVSTLKRWKHGVRHGVLWRLDRFWYAKIIWFIATYSEYQRRVWRLYAKFFK